MKSTPSALKWLAEKRARVAHDLEQTTRISIEVYRRLESLQLDLAALDRALAIYDPAINPEAIASVNGWKGSYGKRGALKDVVVRVLTQLAPEWVATNHIEALVCLELGLSFELASERKRWYDNTLRKQLKRLATEGLVERQRDPSEGPTSEMGRWRWMAGESAGKDASTLAELRDRSGPPHGRGHMTTPSHETGQAKDTEPVRGTGTDVKPTKIRFGLLQGKLEILDDFDAPLPDDVRGTFEGRRHA